MPVISVIVPVYNTDQYLDTCIKSILDQKNVDFELILIDDGSTDHSGAICDRYALIDDRIKVIHQVNSGQAAARNAGLNAARGTHILFIDSDDYIEPDTLAILLTAEQSNQADMVLCGYKKIYGDRIEEKPLLNCVMPSSGFWQYAHDKKYLVACVMACNKLIRREVFDNLRFREDIINEDTNIIYPLVSRCNTIAFIRECLYCYRIREGSTMTSPYTIKRARVIYDYTYRARQLLKQGADNDAAGALLRASDELKIAYDKLGIKALVPQKIDISAVYSIIPAHCFKLIDRLKISILLRSPILYIAARKVAIKLSDLRRK